MSSTIDRAAGRFGRPFKKHYVASAVGLILATGSVIGLADLHGSAPPVVSAPQTIASVEDAGISASSRALYYIVGSEAEKRALEEQRVTAPGWFQPAAGVDEEARIVVFASGAEESLEALNQLIPEASISTANGRVLKLVDMRTGS